MSDGCTQCSSNSTLHPNERKRISGGFRSSSSWNLVAARSCSGLITDQLAQTAPAASCLSIARKVQIEGCRNFTSWRSRYYQPWCVNSYVHAYIQLHMLRIYLLFLFRSVCRSRIRNLDPVTRRAARPHHGCLHSPESFPRHTGPTHPHHKRPTCTETGS